MTEIKMSLCCKGSRCKIFKQLVKSGSKVVVQFFHFITQLPPPNCLLNVFRLIILITILINSGDRPKSQALAGLHFLHF